ncbi:hypothetical protein [Comamonas sp.]|uniref:hypothetical protein n=1 Tax=Comamonas sp. TaxID=34028 RepID=UPI003A90F03C
MSIHPLDAAKQQWQQASAAHVLALKAVRIAQESLEHLQGLIAEEAAKLTAAQAEQRAGILAAFGLGGKAEKNQQNVADIRAHLDAFESVLPEHQQALQQAQGHAGQTDAAVKAAERAILRAKASIAIETEAKAFAVFKVAHLHRLAVGAALNDRELAVMQVGPGYWAARLYGERHYIDFTAPGLDVACADLVSQAEQGK